MTLICNPESTADTWKDLEAQVQRDNNHFVCLVTTQCSPEPEILKVERVCALQIGKGLWDWSRWQEAKSVTAGAAYLSPCFLFSHAGAHVARRRHSFTLPSINIYSIPLIWDHRDE